MVPAILRLAVALSMLAAGGIASVAFAAENRVALVIGNAAYRHASVLANPGNDAADMAAAAERLGFKVIKGIDLDKSGMDRTIRQFADALRGASVGMFFYAGHGMQVNGRNFLVPTDAELKTAEALDFEMVGLDVVQRIMEGATETNILFVDACRDNPLARNLARAMGTRSAAIGHGLTAQEAGAGTLISFSTQPGNVALDGVRSRNSPYAGALVKHIATQGKDLPAVLVQVRRDVMATTGKRQIPWEHSALTGEVVLAPQSSAAAGRNAEPAKGDAGSEAETKTAGITPSEPVAETPATQQVVKAGGLVGTLQIINSKSNAYLYNENGRKLLMKDGASEGALPVNKAVELPAGRYHIKSDTDLLTIKPFAIQKGEAVIVDFQKHVGSLRMLNNKEDQYIFTESDRRLWIDHGKDGKFRMGAVPPNKAVELPPGRYRLQSGNPLVPVEPFEIKAGAETVVDFGG